MNKNAKNILTLFLSCLLFVSCKTVDLERQAEPEISGDASLKSVEDEKERNESEMHEYLIQEELKVQDIAPTVVYVEKPVYSGLDSSFVIITDRRVYHLRIKSYKDTHMAMVKFTYPNTRNVWAKSPNDNAAKGVSIENDYITVTNPEYLSFDYKMKYGFRKPEFLPQRVYDDGNKTYIVVDDIVLHKRLPLVFNERNEIVNYTVQKNVFIIPRLINKITLRLEKQKVTIEKKKSKNQKAEIADENAEGRE